MGTPVAYLGGIRLANAAAVSWAEVVGVNAPTVTWTVHEDQWKGLEKRIGEPLTLEIKPDNAPTLTWQKLYILREVPTALPFHRSFLVTDARWRWPRVLVSRSFNIPRKTGNRRLVGEGPVEVKQAIDEYGYAYTSINDGAKWTAKDAVASVLDRLATECGHSFRIESFPINEQRQVTIEGVDLAEAGDVALAHVLAHAPGAMVTMNKHGEAVVFDGTKRSDTRAQMEKSIPRTEAGQIDRTIDLSPIRPKSVMVYFQREVELRFDSVEESGTVESRSDWRTDERMLMENVLALPDPVTTIGGEQVTQGTIVPVWKALAAWNDDLASLGASPTPPALTLENVRKYWFHLEAIYTPLGELTLTAAQANWAARISTLRAAYRQMYQIPKAWRQRMRTISPTRVGILDPVTATRSPARAWSQYTIEPTSKAHFLGARAATDKNWYWLACDNYPGYTGELSDKASSPAAVEIVDADLGVVRINYRTDPHGMRAQIHPSLMGDGAAGKIQAPNRDLSKQLREVMSTTGRVTGAAPIKLADDFRVAVVFTATPFAPNDERRLFGYRVKPDDITGIVAADFDVAGGAGQEWALFCPPNLMTARYAWASTEDARKGAASLFGFDDNAPVAGTNNPFEVPGFFITNMAGARRGEGGLIEALAQSMAVAQWAAFTNCVEGTPAVHFRPSIEPRGSIEAVRHSLGADGRLLTTVSMPSGRVPLDPLAAIPQALRTKILHTVEEGIA